MGISRTTFAARGFALPLLLGAAFGCTARAANIPIALIGWNADVIAENTAANPQARSNANVNGYVWYETGAPGSSQGLPVSGSFVSAFNSNTTFQFQPYTSQNVVINSGTLTLAAPSTFDALEFLTSAYQGSTFSGRSIS